ncbi:Peptidase family S41 [Clostridium putrefaciens]|uniref:Peptidase family S41 n=1 Tax=Clostridium putrefaciens TaxID=99675 RepID=A0A381J4Q7_9CLOT|nr:S41 family peptidase [Clostridium putrefaciens]SUY45392.1 Peptidase family S41 [Clostridium putrefaciens]
MKRKIIIFVGLTLSILVCITVMLLNKSFVNNNYKVLFEKVGNQNEYYTEDTVNLNNYMYEHDPKELGIPEDSLQYINTALDTDSFLIDNKVASSGESFINYLKTLENVILVGTNTSGAYISNVYTKSQLPSSHIKINFGNTITLNKYCEEGKGFQPDIWIDNEDSLDRVLKLINQFRINPFILGNI